MFEVVPTAFQVVPTVLSTLHPPDQMLQFCNKMGLEGLSPTQLRAVHAHQWTLPQKLPSPPHRTYTAFYRRTSSSSMDASSLASAASFRPCLVGVASTPSHQYSWLKMAKAAVFRWISLTQSIISDFLVHFFTLLDVLTIMDHIWAGSVSLFNPPLRRGGGHTFRLPFPLSA